jgi:hypothetical protein
MQVKSLEIRLVAETFPPEANGVASTLPEQEAGEGERPAERVAGIATRLSTDPGLCRPEILPSVTNQR